MVRARLKPLFLASSLLLATGCAAPRESECNEGGWFSRFRLASRTSTPSAPCNCEGEGGGMVSNGSAPVLVPPNVGPEGYGPPNGMMAPPNTFVQPPNGFSAPPNGFAAPPPTIMTAPPGAAQPPRIIPVPQANPMPYTPH